MLYPYKPNGLQQCLSERSLVFLGDSTARDLFWAVSHNLDHARALDLHSRSGKHQNITFDTEKATVGFIWDPFLNATGILEQYTVPDSPKEGMLPTIFVVGAGLWHIKHLGTKYQGEPIDFLQPYSDFPSVSSHVLLLPISVSQSKRLTLNPSEQLHSESYGHWSHLPTKILSSKNASINFTIFQSYLDMIEGATTSFETDGIHVSHTITPSIAGVLLNSICNPLGHIPKDQSTAYCCVPRSGTNIVQKLLLILALIFVLYRLFKYVKHRRYKHFSSDGSPNYNKHLCVAESVTRILIALSYCFVADRSVLFEKSSKLVDPTSFTILSCFMILVGLMSSTSVAAPIKAIADIASFNPRSRHSLSRSQTEEWKGWMQITILLYHYFGMSKVIWAYQLARVLVASYLFMTGYGHTMYFLRTGDFSSRRIALVLFRTNILSIMLSFTMGTQFDLYYFPMLSSLWFLIIYITMIPLSKSRLTTHELLFRIVLSTLTVRSSLAASSIIESLLESLANPGLGLVIFDGKEFMFRFRLDAYIVYIGMLAGIYCSRECVDDGTSTKMSSRTTFDLFRCLRWSRRLAVPGSLCLLFSYVSFCWFFADKYAYNSWHPITSPFVVVAYAILRNSSERLSRSYSPLLAWFGRCSLETFVLQYHIWLASNSHGLLRFRMFDILLSWAGIKPGIWTDVTEFSMLSAIFLYISSTVSSALPILTAKFLDEQECPASSLKSMPDRVKLTCNTLERRTLSVDFRMKLALLALLLWGLNICWLYSE